MTTLSKESWLHLTNYSLFITYLMIIKDNNFIPWHMDNLQIDILVEYLFGFNINVLPTLWHKQKRVEYIKWEETKALMEAKLDKALQ